MNLAYRLVPPESPANGHRKRASGALVWANETFYAGITAGPSTCIICGNSFDHPVEAYVKAGEGAMTFTSPSGPGRQEIICRPDARAIEGDPEAVYETYTGGPDNRAAFGSRTAAGRWLVTLLDSQGRESHVSTTSESSAREEAEMMQGAGFTVVSIEPADEAAGFGGVPGLEVTVEGSRIAGAPSDVCPQCGAKTDPTVRGDTLVANCEDCGWSGFKRKAGAESHSFQMECNECGNRFKRSIGPNTFEVKCPKCGSYDTEPDPSEYLGGRKMALKCEVCGDSIEHDPSSEDPSTYHHDSGTKHDHEAKPASDSKESRRTAATCSCAHNSDGSVTTTMCPLHADEDPCWTMARVTGKRRRGSIVNGVCSNCGWTESARRTAAEGQTCEVCGDSIARDPEGEEPRTYHHTSGDKHDHEAKPASESKESRRVAVVKVGSTAEEVWGFSEMVLAYEVGGGGPDHDFFFDRMNAAARGRGIDPSKASDALDASRDSLLYEAIGLAGYDWDIVGGVLRVWPRGVTIHWSARTAGRYCTTHEVWVGEGNADTHSRDSCNVEQRKTEKSKESRRVTAEGDACPARDDGGDHLYGHHDGKCRLCGADYDRKESVRRTAGVYCKTHDVWVGEGNAATHEDCDKEQKATEKTKESMRTEAAILDEMATTHDYHRLVALNDELTQARTARRERISSEASLDLEAPAEVSYDTPSFVATHVGPSGLGVESGLMWDAIPFDDPDPTPTHHRMVAAATVWFNDVPLAVKLDTPEFSTQAAGAAMREASSLGTQREAALSAFLSEADRLRSKELTHLGYVRQQRAERRTAGEKRWVVDARRPDGTQAWFEGFDTQREADVVAGVERGHQRNQSLNISVVGPIDSETGEALAARRHAEFGEQPPDQGEDLSRYMGDPPGVEGPDPDSQSGYGESGYEPHLPAPGGERDQDMHDPDELDVPAGTGAASPGSAPPGESVSGNDYMPAHAQRKTASRPLYEIADDIEAEWGNVNFAARPYLDAMHQLSSIDDMYFMDDAKSIVLYFLSNASSFRGERAKELKAELKGMLKSGSRTASDDALYWNASGQVACGKHLMVGGSLYKQEGWEPIPADVAADSRLACEDPSHRTAALSEADVIAEALRGPTIATNAATTAGLDRALGRTMPRQATHKTAATISGIHIPYGGPPQAVRFTSGDIEAMYAYTSGSPFDVVSLPFGDLWVNDEFLFLNADAFNSVATDVAGLGGRTDLLLTGIKGDCLLTGPADAEGETTSVTQAGRNAVDRVAREKWGSLHTAETVKCEVGGEALDPDKGEVFVTSDGRQVCADHLPEEDKTDEGLSSEAAADEVEDFESQPPDGSSMPAPDAPHPAETVDDEPTAETEGQDAADVAGVPTPGQRPADYPQPSGSEPEPEPTNDESEEEPRESALNPRAAAFRARVQAALAERD